jgi:glycosyltransferase involved in cell wall biosynthesis
MKALARKLRTHLFSSYPLLSIVVVVFNMAREATRTLQSLSASYQVGVSESEYEIVVVDNGSVPPFRPPESRHGNVRYLRIDNASPSPAAALNFGVRQSRGRYVATIIDGARLLTPGVIRYALRAFQAFSEPVVTVPAWHLGPDLQSRAMRDGYDKDVEDKLLERIGWPANAYRLFEISTLPVCLSSGF